MTEGERDLHQEIGSLREFKEWAKSEFDRLHDKIDRALEFKFKTAGAIATIAFLVSLAVNIWLKRSS